VLDLILSLDDGNWKTWVIGTTASLNESRILQRDVWSRVVDVVRTAIRTVFPLHVIVVRHHDRLEQNCWFLLLCHC